MKRIFYFIAVILCIVSISCSKEEEKETITEIIFSENNIEMDAGELKAVKVTVLPETRKTDCEINYSLEGDVESVEICDETSSGFILKAIKRGSCVLKAECEGIYSYLEIKVYGANADINPYIILSEPSCELEIGERKQVSASLYGGSPEDEGLFEWKVSDEEIIEINHAMGSCVITGKKSGYAELKITHPKASYETGIMVFVNKEKESQVYITTEMNVIKIEENGGTENLKVQLRNSVNENNSLFQFKIEEGNECIDIISNNNVCSITPKKCGEAVIKVTHEEAEIPLSVHVVIYNNDKLFYIESDNPFIQLKKGEATVFKCWIEENDDKEFVFEVENEEIIDVSNTDDIFYVRGLKKGNSKIIISNKKCENSHEVYVNVEEDMEELYYITTTQNIIKTEIGKQETELYIYLPNGNESDRNDFKWEIEDSSVIDIITSDGTVKGRSAINNVITSMTEAKAMIKPLKEGTSEITVTHPKSSNELKIKVIVYPENTLIDVPCTLKGSGIIKVIKGEECKHELKKESGEREIGELNWKIKDESIAECEGNGLEGIIFGKESGVTSLSVEGNSLLTSYNAIVISGTKEEIEETKVIYSDIKFIELFKEEETFIDIKENGNINGVYECTSDDNDIIECKMSGNILIIRGKKKGNSTITVKNNDSKNYLQFEVKVIEESSIRYPYYFKNGEYIGIINGNYKIIESDLIGAGEEERNKISWRIEDEEIAEIKGNGKSCRVEAKKTGITNIYAHHDKAADDVKYIIYTADTEEELKNKIILNTDKKNYLCKTGETIHIKIELNNYEENYDSITWESDDISIIEINSNYDDAYIKCLKEGNVKITVKCKEASPLYIFISVKDELSEDLAEITVPSIIELEEDETIKVKAATEGFTDNDIENLEWNCENENIIINGNGLEARIKGIKKGNATVNLRQKEKGIQKRIEVIIYAKGEKRSPVIGIEKSFYQLNLNEIIQLKLSYGNVIPDEKTENGLIWKTNDNDIIEIISNGRNAEIKGINEGKAEIIVYGDGFLNELKFNIIVKKESKIEKYFIETEKIKGIIKGESEEINVKLIDSYGNEILEENSNFEFINENEKYFKVIKAQNSLRITGLIEGEGYIRLIHPLVNDEYRIFVYVVKNEEQLNEYKNIYTEKEHYMLSIGESKNINVRTVGFNDCSSMKWSLSEIGIIDYKINDDKKTVKIIGKRNGTVIMKASIESHEIEFKISVSEYCEGDENYQIITENIIGLKKDSVYETEIITNIKETDISKLSWTSSNPSVCDVNGAGIKGVLTAYEKGITEITVKYNSSIYSVIVVYVENNDEDIKKHYSMNVEKRYRILKTDENDCLVPFYGIAVADDSKTKITDELNNNVVKIEKKSGFYNITGLNEGISRLKVENPKTNSFYIYYEVRKGEKKENNGNEVKESIENGYLTIGRNLLVLEKGDIEGTDFEILPVGIDEKYFSSIKWTNSNKKVCTINGNGKKCTVYPNSEGEAYIYAESAYSDNKLEIKIIVKEKEKITVPSIKLSSNVIELEEGDEEKIECSVINQEFDIMKFIFENSNNDVCDISREGNYLIIKGKKKGQSVITVKYEDLSSVKCVAAINGKEMENIFLSTEDNYKIIRKGESEGLKVELYGLEELNQDNFTWEYSDEKSKNIVNIKGKGKTVIAEGMEEGTANITVRHKDAIYPLHITLRVTDDLNYKNVYVKAEKRILNLTEGGKEKISVELINGDESEYSFFKWEIDDESSKIIKVTESGNQAVIQGLKSGIARIIVNHSKADNGNGCEIIVVVEEKNPEDMLYITTGNSVLEMKTTDPNKTINATLQGGTSYQQTLFNWKIQSYESIIKNVKDGIGYSKEVIKINASQDTCIITPVNEGEAVIRISNSATDNYLDVKVIVNDYSELKFEKASIEVEENSSITVNVISPSSKTVLYESSSENIVQCYGTNKVCSIEGLKAGTAVVRAWTTDGTLEDEIIVKVNKAAASNPYYIKTSMDVLSLDANGNSSGVSVKAQLNGDKVYDYDHDSIVWTIGSKDTSVIKLNTSSKTTGKGKEISIIPQGQGTDEIILTHEKSGTRQKKIYVTVTQGAVSLKLSKDYVSLSLGEGGSLTAHLTGTAAGEEQNVVWSTQDSTKVSLKDLSDNGKEKNNVTGDTCYIEGKAICEEGTVITCTYKNIVKYCYVFVREEPILHLPVSNDEIRFNTVKYYQIDVNDAIKMEEMYLETFSTNYITKETCIVKDVKGSDAPEGIRVPYLKVYGGTREGSTKLTVKCGDLSATLNMLTTNKCSIEMIKAVITDKDGKVEEIESPKVINCPYDAREMKIYYEKSPETLVLNVDKINEYRSNGILKRGDSVSRNNIPGFITNDNNVLNYGDSETEIMSVEKGTDLKGEYLKIIPKEKIVQFDFNFVAVDDMNNAATVGICFYCKNFKENITILNYTTNNLCKECIDISVHSKKYKVDIENGIINIPDSGYLKYRGDYYFYYGINLCIKNKMYNNSKVKAEIKFIENKYSLSDKIENSLIRVYFSDTHNKDSMSSGRILSTEYGGFFNIYAEYISGYNKTEKFEKTFVVFIDKYEY